VVGDQRPVYVVSGLTGLLTAVMYAWAITTINVYILEKARAGNAWRSNEGSQHGVGWHEYALSKRMQFSNRDAVSGHDEHSSLVQVTHDSPAFAAELTLGDPSRHDKSNVARALREAVLKTGLFQHSRRDRSV
jgi:hypothetical protein